MPEPEGPSKKIPSIGELLSQFGISSDFAQKVRFRGPVGKLALLGVVCIVFLGGVGVRSSDARIQGLCAALATLVALAIAIGILWYSHEHPDQAALEGMEVVVLHQQKAWAAKGLDIPKDSPVIPDPGRVPELNPPQKEDQ